MNKYVKIAIVLILCLISGGVLYLKNPHLFRSHGGISIVEIQTTPSDTAGAPQDVVVFSNKKTLSDMGYDVVLVGTVWLKKSEPIFLFKAFSCRACEPKVSLWIYNAQQRTTESYPFPGKHFLLSAEGDKPEAYDRMTEAVFGRCGGQEQSIVIAQKHQEESDNWAYTTTTISLSDHGNVSLVNSADNSFEKIKSLVNSDCQAIEPEDSHDYM